MAEENDANEKTEEPTDRRKTEARKDGQVGHSKDLSGLIGMIAAYLGLQIIAPDIWDSLIIITKASFNSSYFHEPMQMTSMRGEFIGLIRILMPPVFLLMFVTAFFGAGSTLLQTKFLWSWKKLEPKFNQLNPINGLKRIFGAQNAIQLLKSIAQLSIICPIAYFAFMDLFPELSGLMKVSTDEFFPYTIYAADYIFWRIVKFFIVIAIIDFVWQRYYTHKQMKMSKQEIKEERKSVEGDEETKRKMISQALSRARNKMFQNIPTADVVVTNPTHLAVALSYSMERGQAPKVIAKGRGFVAQRIKEKAREHGIPVIERKPLARALFKSVDVGMEIPYELYHAIAELLAYIYKIKGKKIKSQG